MPPRRWLQTLWRPPLRLARFFAPLAPDQALHRLTWAFTGLTLTCLIGVLGYTFIDNFSPFDALYQTLLTITTVGFHEIHPLSREARAFTIFLMLFGVGIALYLVGVIATLIFEGDLYRDVGRRRQQRMIEQMSNHTIYIGVGVMGTMILELTTKTENNFLIVEQNETAAQHARERGWPVIEANAEEVDTLRQANLERARHLYIMTGQDSSNLMITLRAKQIAPQLHITTRVNRPGNEDLMHSAGATNVLSPLLIAAQQIAAAHTDPS